MPSTLDIVLQEIIDYNTEFHYTGIDKYLNNFILRLPDRRWQNGSWYNKNYDPVEWETKHKELPPRKHTGLPRLNEGHSDLYLNQSPREFFETICRVIAECGIPIETIEKLWEKNENTLLEVLTFPVYVRLRELGYNKSPDLTK